MVALRCIAAARNGFLLAALHSVAERVNPRKARPPTPHGPRVLAKQRVPICRCWEKSARLQGSARTRTPSLEIFSTLGDTPRSLGIGNEAADRGGGGVREGLSGQRGTDRYRWYACPWRTLFATEWSAARKNPLRAVALHSSAAISADDKARRILTSGRRKFPSAEIFDARATLREQRESAVGRRPANRPRPP